LVAAALFAVLVHAVLVAAHVSGPLTNQVHGMTLRRLWATTAVGLGLAGLIVGSMALVRAARRIGNHGRNGAIVALVGRDNCPGQWGAEFGCCDWWPWHGQWCSGRRSCVRTWTHWNGPGRAGSFPQPRHHFAVAHAVVTL